MVGSMVVQVAGSKVVSGVGKTGNAFSLVEIHGLIQTDDGIEACVIKMFPPRGVAAVALPPGKYEVVTAPRVDPRTRELVAKVMELRKV